jgi:hypothetical protein
MPFTKPLYKLSDNLQTIPEYIKIKNMLDRLSSNPDVLAGMSGKCVSACDIVQNMLVFYGVKSKIIECQAMLIKRNQQFNDFQFVGFDNIGLSNESIDTHVVVITETNPPILIDAAIGGFLPQDEKILVRELNSTDGDIMGDFSVDDVSITYRNKKNIKLPGLHQKNLLERLKEDIVVKEELRLVKTAAIAGLLISLSNMIFNITLLILKLLYL